MLEISDLLNCPFCGGEAEYHKENGNHYIACVNKDHACMVGPSTQTYRSPEGAILAWNLRTSTSDVREVESHHVDAVLPTFNKPFNQRVVD